MPKRCAAFNCRGNYDGEPYSQVVSFPTDRLKGQDGLRPCLMNLGVLKIEKRYLSVHHTLNANG